MVGFGQAWRVSGLTKEHAQRQGPAFHEFGYRIHRMAQNDTPFDAAKMVPLARKLLDLRKCHDEYTMVRAEHHHDGAVEFLVLFSALATGLDGLPFDWSAIRQLSQGVYTRMMDTPYVHMTENFPKFDAVCDLCRGLMSEARSTPWRSSEKVEPAPVERPQGEFGYVKTNPILGDANWFCRRLRCASGHGYWYHRLGTVGRGPDGHIVDQIEAQCFGGESRIHLFFDMYHTVPSPMVPRGLSMEREAIGRGSTRGRVSPFPQGLSDYDPTLGRVK